jgi:glutathione S-transferase
MIKLWGRHDSSNVQKVSWCCDEIGVKFERVDIGGRFGGNREKPYLDLNPNGLIPTIEDGGFILWESNAIVRYLVEKYGQTSGLLPPTVEGRANADRWMDWQLTVLTPVIAPLYWGLVRTPEEKRDKAAIEANHKKTVHAWQIFDDYLSAKRKCYVEGEDLTIGDIPLGVWAYRWFNLSVDRPKMAHVEAWYEGLTRRPAYQKHVMIKLS